ncbi:WD40 repeat domain-containing protein [Limnoglobus roseus]|uniref:WD40 repeat domain-containing protein n=1 Tax=Limnoglobus roseus TaxID=2598579 RepID=A0A5C1AAB3_9BACT|nr:WD40 repeat domain-containing protein [Limnoglobus roseus]QEL15670.1 WD40 repeat domain-containing protein [Limnoglobus roseus]
MFRFTLLLLAFAPALVAAPPVTALAYRGDGQLLAAGTHGVVTLIDPATGDAVATLPQTGRVTALAFSKAGTLAVAAGEPGKAGVVRLYDFAVGKLNVKPTAEFTAHRDAIYTLAFSPDGTLASAGYDRVIKLWNPAKTEAAKLTLEDHSDAVYAVAFHPDGKLLASGSADRAVKIWDAATGKRLYTLGDPTDWVYAVAWSPDGKKLVAGGVDKSIRTWEATADGGKLLNSVFAHTRGVLRLSYSPDGGTLYSVGEDAVVKSWDAAKMVEKKVFAKQPDVLQSLALRPDGKQLAAGRFDGAGLFLDPVTAASGATFLPAKPKPPVITKITPNAGPRFKTIRVVVEGQRLDAVTRFGDPDSVQKGGLALSALSAEIVSRSPDRLEVDLRFSKLLAAGSVQLVASNAAGVSTPINFMLDNFDAVAEQGTTDSARSAMLVTLPTTIVGSIDRAGDTDYFAFDATAGQQVGVHAVVAGKFEPRLAITDAAGRVLTESDGDKLGYVVPAAGRYAVTIRDRDYRGGAAMTYRLHVGDVPVVMTVFPLAVARGKEADVHVDGVNLGPTTGLTMRAKVPSNAAVGSRESLHASNFPYGIDSPTVAVGEFPSIVVTDAGAELRSLPMTADGILAKPGQTQAIKFPAKKGVPLVVEVHARRLGSPLDSSIEILDAAGKPVERATLRCVAKTFSTFRDNDSATSGIRLESWNELAMNDYLYVGSELMRINALPKGPDDDCQFVARGGQRLGYLGTTPTHHYLGNVMYKVEFHPPGTTFPPNGMPVFPILYQNDDGGPGFGKDSFLLFDPPADGTFQVRIGDSRGVGGPAHAYRLTVRPPRPGFTVDATPKMPSVWKGNGVPITVTATRIDGYEGPIRVKLVGVPPGFHAPAETTIEAEQVATTFTLFADGPAMAKAAEVVCEATATINGKPVTQAVSLGVPKVVEPGDLVTSVSTESLTIQPGKETKFTVRVERRNGFKGRVPLDVRGLPHGVRVMNIGLNGILLTERDSEREVVIYAEPWVKPMTHPITVLSRRESTGKEYAAKSVTLTVK